MSGTRKRVPVIAGSVLVALLLLTFAPASSPAAQADQPLAAVQRLLAARTAALTAGDRDAWLGAVDPNASSEFRAAQARSFDGLRALPLENYRLVARLDDSGDLSAGLSYPGTSRRFLPETRQVYRLTGFDDRDAIDTLWWTYVERGGRWYIAADSDLRDLGLDTTRNIWDLGAMRVRATAHFLVLSHPEQAERADALASIAEDAMTTHASRWSRPWLQRIPLVLPGSVDELETMLQSTFDLDNFVAFVSYGVVRDTGFAPTAPRIFIQDRNLGRYSREFQIETLVHELVHAASVPLIGPLIPSWVHEGLADWVAKGRGASEARPRGSDGKIPRDYEFTIGGGTAIVRSYEESRSSVTYLAGRHGLDAPANLFAALGAASVAPGNSDYQVDRALRAVTGNGFDSFERAWAKS